MSNRLAILWHYRGFILSRVRLDIIGRTKGSVLGLLWLVLPPLAQITVFTVIFANVMRARLPGVDDGLAYSVFLFSGILSWGLFTEVLTRCQGVFVDYATLLKKASFPRLCLPVIVSLSSLANFGILLSLFLAFLLVTGRLPAAALAGILPLVAIEVMLAVGMGMILGTLHVFFRDVGHGLHIALQFWFWLTPIVYPIAIVPEAVRSILQLNPMTPVVLAWQGLFLEGRLPDWTALLPTFALALVMLMAGFALFRRHAEDLVDEL